MIDTVMVLVFIGLLIVPAFVMFVLTEVVPAARRAFARSPASSSTEIMSCSR